MTRIAAGGEHVMPPGAGRISAGSRGADLGPGIIGRFSKSIRVQLIALLLIFSVPPWLLYSVFEAAERDKQELLQEAVRDNGRTVAQALTPFIQAMQPGDISRIPEELARFESAQRSIKVLFRPAEGNTGFYYVASAPFIPAEDLAAEREQLMSLGVLEQLEDSCSGDIALGQRVTDFRGEILLSITPIQSARGCWLTIVAADEAAFGGFIDGRPYWERPEARLAAVIYVIMAVLVFAVFASVWLTLARFKRAAATVEHGSSFAATTAVPELMQMGSIFDAMVARLRHTTDILRRAAEENAHAFKAPLAVIRQATELVARKVDDSGSFGIKAINASVDRLEGLVRSAQHLDVATAELLNPRWFVIDLSEVVSSFVSEYQLTLEIHSVQLAAKVTPGLTINGQRDMLETVLENIIDNAVSFSPKGGVVSVELAAKDNKAVLTVADEGPGVTQQNLPQIFDRYYSHRPESGDLAPETHYGIGLWLVMQNVQAMGGYVRAENGASGGFTVTVELPLAEADQPPQA